MDTIYRNITIEGDLIDGQYSRNKGESWISFMATIRLFRIQAAMDASTEAFRRIWMLQDGYGEPGCTPPQGYDWSGIRDSTAATVKAMDSVAMEYVTDADLSKMLGVEVNYAVESEREERS